jgi:hypothetical protein
VDGVDHQSLYNREASHHDRAKRNREYCEAIMWDVVPYVRNLQPEVCFPFSLFLPSPPKEKENKVIVCGTFLTLETTQKSLLDIDRIRLRLCLWGAHHHIY